MVDTLLHDRIHPASGRLISASPVMGRASCSNGCSWQPCQPVGGVDYARSRRECDPRDTDIHPCKVEE